MQRKSLFILLVLLVVPLALSAQTKAALSVQCNVSGAQVFVNNTLMGNTAPNVAILLVPRTYQIRVSKKGYEDFNTTINLTNAGLVLPVTLNPKGAPAPAVVPPPQVIQHSISINANIQGADVIINGNMAGKTPFNAQVPPGSYSVTVRAPGYLDFNQNVVVNGPTQVNAMLQGMNYGFSVNANIQGAEVFINGTPAGKTPYNAQVPGGTYNVTVRAPGYQDFNQSVGVNGPTQVNAILQAMNYGFSVNANIQGAEVFINGTPAGKTPYNAQVPGGTYNVTVRAFGYQDFNQTLLVSGPTQVNAVLQPSFASWQVVLPEAFVNRDLKGGHWSQIQIYVDGAPQKGPNGAVPAGRHVIRMTSGGMAYEAQVDFQPGRTYTLEPSFGFTIK